MTAFLYDITIIFLLLLCNGFLAMTEMAIVSARKSKLMHWAEKGDNNAKLALEIANAPTKFLSCIQVGITLVALLTGIFGGATIADDLADRIRQVEHLAPHADAIAMGIVVTILTYVSLIVGELVPKRIALSSPELIAKYAAIPMSIVQKITRPLVWLLSASTEAAIRVLGIKSIDEAPVTEAEIQVLVEQATEAGIFEEAEQEMVESILCLDNKRLSSLMTPRREIKWLDRNHSEEAWLDLALKTKYSRLLVAEESLDHILGIVETKELFKQKLTGAINLESLLAQPMMVPENMTALDLIERFRGSSQEAAVVLDEYGGVSGIISREDIFEAIVGDLPASGDFPKKWELLKQDDSSWLIDGHVPIKEFKEYLDIDESLPGEGEEDYATLAGFVLYQLERVPVQGDTFTWKEFHFEILSMDRHRIDKVLVKRLSSN